MDKYYKYFQRDYYDGERIDQGQMLIAHPN